MAINLPTDLLRSFITVADLGGYTRAGEVLNRSQPAISLQMRRLEELVDTQLITHDGRQLNLTEAGEILSAYARQILHLNDDAISHFRPSDISGTIRVGLPTDYAVAYLQEAVARFALKHSDAKIEILCDLSANLLDSLNGNQVDVAVALVSEDQKQYLVHAWEERPVWVVGKHSAADKLNPLPLVGHFENCEYRKRMTAALKSQDMQWRHVYNSPDISGVQDAVEIGLGLTALTRATLTSKMRILDGGDGFPELEKIRIGLFYKLPRMAQAGRELANQLVDILDRATDKHFTRSAHPQKLDAI